MQSKQQINHNQAESQSESSSLQERPIPTGMILLPNLFTTGTLFAGFFSIIATVGQHYETAAIAVIIAGVLDGLDGRIARATGAQTEFGTQYDSMADMVSFGVAPSLLAYMWSLVHLGEIGQTGAKLAWTAAFIYCACVALRLARFNAQIKLVDKKFFQGLSSPAAAGVMVSLIWFACDHGIAGDSMSVLMAIVCVVLGGLMFSHLRYASFKQLPEQPRPLMWAFAGLFLVALLALDTSLTLLIAACVYMLSGIILTWRERSHRRMQRRK